MTFYRRYFDDAKREDVSRAIVLERFRDNFQDPECMIEYMQANPGESGLVCTPGAAYWWEN